MNELWYIAIGLLGFFYLIAILFVIWAFKVCKCEKCDEVNKKW